MKQVSQTQPFKRDPISGRTFVDIAKKRQRAWWDADAPAVITPETKITVAPRPPQPTKSNTFESY